MKAGAKAGSLTVLSEGELQRIHAASLALLQDPGVVCQSDRVIEVLKRGGASVDAERRVVRLSPEMVATALESAPRSFPLHGRDPEMDLLVEPGRVYYGVGGTSEPFYWDYELGKPRPPTKADMVRNTQVAQALPHVDFVMALCSSRDVPMGQVFLHDYDAIFRNTTKPVVFSVLGRRHTALVLEMAAAACGGEGELRARPWVLAYVTPVSPLLFTRLNEGIVEAAEHDVPILYGVGPMMGATAPATLSGALAQGNAEVLFGLVLSQLVKPGIPFVHSPHTPAMDMRTAQCTYGSPEQALGRVAAAQLAGFYDLPSFNTGGGVEAKSPDSQAAAEAMMGMLLNGLAGMTLTQTMGTLASGLYGSVEMLAICDEIAHMVKHILNGFLVDEESLALEVIRQVGPGGQFLDQPHTAAHFRRELFFPRLFERQSIDQWLEGGARSALEVAHDRVEEILARAGPAPLPPGADQALRRALREAIEQVQRLSSEV